MSEREAKFSMVLCININ